MEQDKAGQQNKKHHPIVRRAIGMGAQAIYRFPNGYGASVVIHEGSYGANKGLLELAVVKFNSSDELDFSLCYDTPITDDVIGHLPAERVTQILDQIEALPAATLGDPDTVEQEV